MVDSLTSAQQLTPTPLLTIVTITLNDQEGLVKTVRSILRQNSADPYEHIIIDGMSNYNVASVLTSLGSSARLIAGLDAGLYDAMNKGIRAATGEYVLFLNSGDCLAANDVLSQIAGVINNEQPDLIYADSLEKQLDGETFYKKSRKLNMMPFGMITHHQAMVFRRNVIERHRLLYNLSYPIAADYDFCLRFCHQAVLSVYLPIALATFQSGGVSQVNPAQGRTEQYFVRREYFKSALFAQTVRLLQKLLWTLRQKMPSLYWLTKQKR